MPPLPIARGLDTSCFLDENEIQLFGGTGTHQPCMISNPVERPQHCGDRRFDEYRGRRRARTRHCGFKSRLQLIHALAVVDARPCYSFSLIDRFDVAGAAPARPDGHHDCDTRHRFCELCYVAGQVGGSNQPAHHTWLLHSVWSARDRSGPSRNGWNTIWWSDLSCPSRGLSW